MSVNVNHNCLLLCLNLIWFCLCLQFHVFIVKHNFRPASIFCALNFFDKRSSPNTLLIAENTISAIHLLPASFKSFHPSYPNFLISRTSSLLNGQPFDLADAFFLIFIAGSALILSSMLKLFLLSYALSPYTLSISYLMAASFTRGPNFFVSCTISFSYPK